MIKCISFSKLLKLFFSIWLISFLGLLGVSFADFNSSWYYYYWNTESYINQWNNIYKFYLNWNFSSSLNWNNINAFYWETERWIYAYAWVLWDLYFLSSRYSPYSSDWYPDIDIVQKQWYINNWCVVPVSSRGDSLHSNCSYQYSLDYIKSHFNWFSGFAFSILGTVSPSWSYWYEPLQLCFSDWINDYCVACWNETCPSSLSGSLWVENITIPSLRNWLMIWNSPFLFSPMQGPIESQPSNNLTWDYVYSTVSYWEIWDYVENKLWYSKYLCYWWIDNFNISSGGVSPIPWTWKNIDEIQLNWHNVYNWTDFFTYRKWLYWQDYLWSSYPYVYKTWFDFYYQYWWANFEFNDVFSYCKTKYILQLNRDTVYNWNNYKGIIDNIIREKRFWLSWLWDIVWVNRNWIWNNDWIWTDKNAVVYIQDFFNLLKENFPTKYDLWLWLLPAYIITFMLAIILFRFISH